MFTGIVTHVGIIRHSIPCAAGTRLCIAASVDFLKDVAVGDSIAVNGVCLTAVSLAGSDFEADVSPEEFMARRKAALAKRKPAAGAPGAGTGGATTE